MKEVDDKDEGYNKSTYTNMYYTRTYLTIIQLMIPQGYHGILDNQDNYILALEKLSGQTCYHLDRAKSVRRWIIDHS